MYYDIAEQQHKTNGVTKRAVVNMMRHEQVTVTLDTGVYVVCGFRVESGTSDIQFRRLRLLELCAATMNQPLS